MPPNNHDAGYLWDMLQAARRIQEFTAGISYEVYLNSALIQSAVERQLEIIGEAARRMSDRFQQEHPEIPHLRYYRTTECYCRSIRSNQARTNLVCRDR